MKNTKRALMLSCLSLLLCVTMLVGSTFAWFSDTATTNVNMIQSGTLKVDLVDEYGSSLKGLSLEFKKAAGHENEPVLWEPGCTYELQDIYVINNGNLALKYKIVITGITGDAKLNEAIEWTIDYGFGQGNEGHLAAGEMSSLPIKISGHMKEEAGNEYQNLTIEGISITVIATQDTVEYDSTDNTYDANADGSPDHPEYVHVNNSAQLGEALENAGANTVVVLNSGKYEITEEIKTDGSFEIAEDADVVLDLGKTGSITTNASSNSDEVKVNEPTVLNKGNLTIVGGTISNNNATAGNTNVAAVQNNGGTLTLKDCTLTNESPTSGGAYAVCVNGGEVILENCIVEGGRGAIAVSAGSLKMIGGSAQAGVYYPVYLVGEATAEFESVTFIKENSSKGKALIYNALTTGSATFTDCTFKSLITSETKLEINSNLASLTFTNCTYDNVKQPQ